MKNIWLGLITKSTQFSKNIFLLIKTSKFSFKIENFFPFSWSKSIFLIVTLIYSPFWKNFAITISLNSPNDSDLKCRVLEFWLNCMIPITFFLQIKNWLSYTGWKSKNTKFLLSVSEGLIWLCFRIM